ncbi:hypothetical protein F8N00_07375 [Exiguobacterium sp. A1_3_1]|uniref:DUF5590 domain-containing protein n=1 Tax=Exiguobacterium indicum TaxID=296995 RepID=A0AAW3M9J1_9BACL|nr:hypothetical protein [Exiguobacterium indicum]KTR25753.1 hypothetical protein RSA11_13485 [Exiguobacterium indicum]
MKKVIIALLAVLVIVAIGLQIREIVNAYQVAYKEELVPDKKAVETNTKQRPLYEIGRAEGEKTRIQKLYAFDQTVNGKLSNVVIVDRKYGLTNKASDDYFMIASGTPVTDQEKKSFEPMIQKMDAEQVQAEVISKHEVTAVENNKERMLTLFKVFYKDTDQNEYLFFIEKEGGLKLDLFKKGYSRLSNY